MLESLYAVDLEVVETTKSFLLALLRAKTVSDFLEEFTIFLDLLGNGRLHSLVHSDLKEMLVVDAVLG